MLKKLKETHFLIKQLSRKVKAKNAFRKLAEFLRDKPEVFGKIRYGTKKLLNLDMARFLGLGQFDTQTVGMDSRLINQVVDKTFLQKNMFKINYARFNFERRENIIMIT